MGKKGLLERLREHVALERAEHESYAKKIPETKNTVVKLLYEQLMNDSQQHANMLLAMIEFVESGNWESRQTIVEDKDEILALMGTEDRALRAYTHMIHEVDDPEMKTLLNILALDEDRHYRILQYVLENYTETATRIGAEA